jgi:hypothetical protein
MPKPETEIERQFAQKISNIRFRLTRLAAIENNLAETDLEPLRRYQTRLGRLLRAYTAEYERLRKDGAARRQSEPAALWSNIPQA